VYALDHTELKTEIQAVQVRWAFGGPQASSGEDINLALDQGKTGASNPIIDFCYNCILIMILACALGYRS
jgi:hypothetical protein